MEKVTASKHTVKQNNKLVDISLPNDQNIKINSIVVANNYLLALTTTGLYLADFTTDIDNIV